MDLENIRNNRVRTILRFAVPSIIAMVLTSLITVADGFFIGNYVGKEGMAAVNLGLPVVYLYLSVGLMLSVGGMAIAGRMLGARNISGSNAVFRQTMATAAAAAIAVSILVYLCFEPMLGVLRADGLVAGYFRDYYMIMLLELPIMVINSSFGMFIRGEGRPQFFMLTNVVNVLMNILLDYFTVRWLHWGVTGIALASLVSAAITLCWTLYYFFRKSDVYKFGGFTFDRKIFVDTVLNGSSEFIGEIALGISMFAYNFVIMRRFGADGVTAFTIVGYIAFLFSMVVIGFGQGSAPVISFTYGAGEPELARSIRRRTNLFVFSAGVLTILIMTILSDWYSGLFVGNMEVREMVRSGMEIFMLSFLCMGINSITSFYFTSIGKAKESAVISSSRGLVVLLACIFILPILFGMTGIWLAAPVTEGITLIISTVFIIMDKNK